MNERRDPQSSRWPRYATLAATLPALLACTDRQVETGFRITNVAFDNDSTITLTFSQPVAELGSVDPNSFRLSIGQTYTLTYSYQGVTQTHSATEYRDVTLNDDYYGTYSNYRFAFLSIGPGASANQIILRTAEPLGPDSCTFVANMIEHFEMYAAYYDVTAQIDVALFLHYAAGDIPIESEAGEPLMDIGADWVLNPDAAYEREGFGFTMLSPQLRIPCP